MLQYQSDNCDPPRTGEGIPYHSVLADARAARSFQPVVVSHTVPAVTRARQARFDITVGKWDTDFCGCFTHCVPNCCMVTYCPCISMAQISSKLGIVSYTCVLLAVLVIYAAELVLFGLAASEVAYFYSPRRHYYLDDYHRYIYIRFYNGGTGSYLFHALSSAAHLLFAIFVWQLRAKTRERFQIPGSCVCDCCAAFFCSCCALAQVATHVKSYKPGTCDFGPPTDTLPAYR